MPTDSSAQAVTKDCDHEYQQETLQSNEGILHFNSPFSELVLLSQTYYKCLSVGTKPLLDHINIPSSSREQTHNTHISVKQPIKAHRHERCPLETTDSLEEKLNSGLNNTVRTRASNCL